MLPRSHIPLPTPLRGGTVAMLRASPAWGFPQVSTLTFQLGGAEVPCEFRKVDRSALYGYTRTEASDGSGRRCRLATLADDGRTLIASGGIALANIDADGNWAEKGSLRAVDTEGKPLVPVPSTLKAPIALDTRATVDQLLEHIVSAAYLIEGADEALRAELAAGAIFTFPFSYRGGLSPDTAFLLAAADGSHWMLVAKRTRITFLGLEQAAAPDEPDAPEEAEDDDSMDFGML